MQREEDDAEDEHGPGWGEAKTYGKATLQIILCLTLLLNAI